MGTRCYIAEEKENGVYRSIYCQLDGYPEVVGKQLVRHYDTPEKLAELFMLGDIYRLGEKTEADPSLPHHVGEGFQKGVTVAFGRDYDETGFAAEDRTLDEIMDDDEAIEFAYVFTKEQEWEFCCLLDYDVEFRAVRDVLPAEHEEAENQSPKQEMNGPTM